VPGWTVSPFAIGCVAAASPNIDAPVAVTLAGTLELTVNGPTDWPVRPVVLAGEEIVRLGGGGWTSGPAAITAATIEATVSCSGSLVFRTNLSVKNQIAAWTAPAFSFSARAAGSLVVG
jgi:hypothetical protein